jgi:ubiquitin-protein ligase E3 C
MQVAFISKQGTTEPGIDGGGLFKEFLDAITKTAFDPKQGLFLTTSKNLITPNPASSVETVVSGLADNPRNGGGGDTHLAYFTFLGKVLGKALYEKVLIEPEFTLPFLSVLQGAGSSLNFDDLLSLDIELYRSLVQLKHFAVKGGDMSSLDLTFAVTQLQANLPVTVPIDPSINPDEPVTNQNWREYIHTLAHFKLKGECRVQTDAFLKGFHELIPYRWIKIFSAPELRLLICGSRRPFDMNDIQRHINYSGGYHPSQPYIQAFWKIIEDLSPEDQGNFLKFVTSCSRQPLLGFSTLSPPFCIQQVPAHYPATDPPDAAPRLPTAGTCMNLLKLPKYEDLNTLKGKLLYAIQSNSGFELS